MSSYSRLKAQLDEMKSLQAATEAELRRMVVRVKQLEDVDRGHWEARERLAMFATFAGQLWQTLHIIGIDVTPPYPIRKDELPISDELSPRERAIVLNELLKPRLSKVKAKRSIA